MTGWPEASQRPILRETGCGDDGASGGDACEEADHQTNLGG